MTFATSTHPIVQNKMEKSKKSIMNLKNVTRVARMAGSVMASVMVLATSQNAKMTPEIATCTMMRTRANIRVLNSKESTTNLKDLKNVTRAVQIIGSVMASVMMHAQFQNVKMTQEIVTMSTERLTALTDHKTSACLDASTIC